MENLQYIEPQLLFRVDKSLPSVWYENRKIVYALSMTVGVATLAARIFTGGLPIPTYIASGLLYGIAALADRKSTMNAFKAQEEITNLGLSPFIEESSLVHRGITTAQEYKSTRQLLKLILETGGAGGATAFPEFGLAFEVGRIFGILNNRRMERRMRLLHTLAQEHISANSQK